MPIDHPSLSMAKALNGQCESLEGKGEKQDDYPNHDAKHG